MDCCDWTGKTIFQSAGGRVIPAGNPVFDNITALSAFRVDPSQNGLVVWVLSVLDAFVYENASDDAEDGITVVLPPADAPGRWIRLLHPNEHWSRQATWFIKADGGNDENDGQTESTPLRTHAELERRINGTVLSQPTNVTLLSSLYEVIRLKVVLADSLSPASLNYFGAKRLPLLRSEGKFSQVFPINVIGVHGFSNLPLSLFDDTLLTNWEKAGPGDTSLIGERIRITSSTDSNNVDAIAWLAKQSTGEEKSVRASPFFNGLGNVTPLVDDQYVVESLMTVDGFDLCLERRGHGNAVCTIKDLAINRAESKPYNSRFKSDNAEARYVLSGCYIRANMLEMDRASFEGCRLQAGDSGRIVISGTAAYIVAGLSLDSGHIIETPVAVFYSGDHLIQGNGDDLGLLVRAPVVEINGLAIFDCNPALVVHHGGAVRVGFEYQERGDTALWGADNGAAADDSSTPTIPAEPAVVVEPGAFMVYASWNAVDSVPGSGPYISAVYNGIRYLVGGVECADVPFVNTNNGAGIVNRFGNGS